MSGRTEADGGYVSPRYEHASDLEAIADQLLAWADESSRGGWSTHQVEPMKKLAADLLIKVRSLRRSGRYYD